MLALEVTDREAVIAALSDASTRIRWDLKEERMPQPQLQSFPSQRFEYATDTSIGDGLNPQQTASCTAGIWTMHWAIGGGTDGNLYPSFQLRQSHCVLQTPAE